MSQGKYQTLAKIVITNGEIAMSFATRGAKVTHIVSI
jgi:hypothetical protein